MTFYGAVAALVMVPFMNVVGLQWTNPPDRDLAGVKFRCWQVGSTDTLQGTTYYGMQWEEMEAPIIYPSSPDSVWFTLPCRKNTSQVWGFQCAPFDTAGNTAAWSNIAYKTVTQ